MVRKKRKTTTTKKKTNDKAKRKTRSAPRSPKRTSTVIKQDLERTRRIWQEGERGKSDYYKGILSAKVPAQYNFVLANGDQVKSLLELVYRIGYMPQWVFDHHTAQGRNDFAKWANDVYNDPKLSRRLGKTNSKEEVQIVVLQRLVDNLRK